MHRDETARARAAEMHSVGVFDELGDRVLRAKDRTCRGHTVLQDTRPAAARAADTPQAPWTDSAAGLRGGASAPWGHPARYEAAERCSLEKRNWRPAGRAIHRGWHFAGRVIRKDWHPVDKANRKSSRSHCPAEGLRRNCSPPFCRRADSHQSARFHSQTGNRRWAC